MRDNLILSTDSYKVGHWVQYPPGTTNIYSYFESRGGDYPETVFFGLQYVLDRILEMTPITDEHIAEAEPLFAAHFGSDKLFNREGWELLIDRHEGKLPIHVKAVPEGTVVPTGNVLMTIENTDPDFYWLTNYLETLLSQVWYPTTVATISHFVRRCILDYLNMTGTPEAVDFKLHDFGFRGASSLETAAIGGAAHLVSFLGTDTIPPMVLLRDHYGATDVPGFSIPAAEHSTMTAWGRDGEIDAYRNMVKQYSGYPFYAVVSDSYDIFNAARHIWGEELKAEVLAGTGTLVVRPDSGDPIEVVARLLNILGDRFGVEVNEKSYRVLNPKVRLIWGDGLEPNTIQAILKDMERNRWSADNIAFGMGGGLLQKVNRDTQKFAFKCSSATVNGEQRDVSKSPVGMEFKKSKGGRLMLVYGVEGFDTIRETPENQEQNLLQTVFLDGEFKRRYTLDEIRAKAKEG